MFRYSVLTLIMILVISHAIAAPPSPAPIALKNISLHSFAAPPPPFPAMKPAALKEAHFTLDQASNFSAVEKRLGGLTKAQKRYLEEHRFVVLPQKAFLNNFPDAPEWILYDEMLNEFDKIGGGGEEYITMRAPEHAVLLNPDVFLQALHTFFSQRLKALEKAELSQCLHVVVQNLHAHARELGRLASNEAKPHWQRLQAQLVIPLVVLENCKQPVQGNPWDAEGGAEEESAENTEDTSDTLDQALHVFASYAKDFSAEQQKVIKEELVRIYDASGSYDSLLGLKPAYPAPAIDYTQFKARGHYENASVTRAYFRAMIWLGQIGWDITTDQGLADSINFALAMSYDRIKNKDAAAQSSLRHAWQRVMEISSFFAGYPDVPAYPQWQEFLTQYGGTGFTQNSCVNQELLSMIRDNLDAIPFPQAPFDSLHNKDGFSVLTVFPQRFTVPWLICDRLTYAREIREDVPAVFSGLWVAALMGSSYAQSLLPEQIQVCLAGRTHADENGAPISQRKSGNISTASEQIFSAEEVQKYVSGLQTHMDALSQTIAAQKPEDWYSSIGSVWFSLLGTLTADYGPGFPLYMQDTAFAAKQLETFMGAFTALKHDTILYEKPNYAEMGSGWEEGDLPPVPKGFVEPNLPFWHSLLRAVDYMAKGFRTFELFPQDLEEYGALSQFKKALELCVALSEKELSNTPLSDEEYEAIRTLHLQYMAAPQNYDIITQEEALSGIVVDIQTANLADQTGRDQVIVYEANAAPYIMLALVGNEDSPRVVTGMVFNHREFVTPYGSRLTDSMWKKRVYGQEDPETNALSPERALPLPEKNFWYDVLQP
ncbi:DUF3160 domain-containing protein [Desulfovibrionales bacterium]